MAWEQFTVSGQGIGTFVHASASSFVVIDVTPGGPAHPVDASDPSRWMDIGWFAITNHFAGDPVIPDGDYCSRFHWIMFAKMQYNLDAVTDSFDWSGASGFRYFLMPGVTATFYWYY